MLRLIIGAARSGKTSAIMDEISALVEKGCGGTMLIVPEQYSHEAERELSARCGDTTSLYAEVLSFTGLARRVLAECGGGAEKQLDKAGKLLCMSYAVSMVSESLCLYKKASGNLELQNAVLKAVDELKGAGADPEKLFEQAEIKIKSGTYDILDEKMHDVALLASAYDAVASNGRLDPSDRLALLEKKLPESSIGPGNRIYFDGFTDFTGMQMRVIKALLALHAQVTVCLTLDKTEPEGSEIFSLSRECAARLRLAADETGTEFCKEVRSDTAAVDPELERYASHLFDWSEARSEKPAQSIRLYKTGGVIEECETAAAEVLRLVRDEGARWKDIAIAARGFADYAPTLRSICAAYGIPLFLAEKTSLLAKPVPALIRNAYNIITGGWRAEDVISYLHTGLTGVNTEEADTLEDYIFLWQLGAADWEKSALWKQNPRGWQQETDKREAEEATNELKKVNELRFRIARPLKRFKDAASEAGTAAGQAKALADFLVEIRLPLELHNRASQLEAEGERVRADEYRQIWEIVCRALEQSADILNDVPMDASGYASVFVSMLGMYDISTIPFSLDSVSAGDFDRMRRRNLKHLIILGADNGRLPAGASAGGIFSEDERDKLAENYGLDVVTGEKELWREFTLIYNVLTLPSRSITVIRSENDDKGQLLIPSVIVDRARALFTIEEQIPDMKKIRLMAEDPAISVALDRKTDEETSAANAWFRLNRPVTFERIAAAGRLGRGSLSEDGVAALYGKAIHFTPSKLATYGRCPSQFYYSCGMRAKPYEPAVFESREAGTCIHYVLEKVLLEVGGNEGLRQSSDEHILELADKYIDAYRETNLGGFSEQSERSQRLFDLLRRDISDMVLSVTEELRNSDFEPMFYELNFSDKPGGHGLIHVGGEESGITVGGVADRVDGWVHEGKMYVRIADYKTGEKDFRYDDVYYGKDYQLLTYLRAVCERGGELFGVETVPAGVMYIPLKTKKIKVDGSDADDSAIQKEHIKCSRRKGMVLDDEEVKNAWDNEEEGSRRFIPLKGNRPYKDSFVSAKRIELLGKRAEENLVAAAGAIREGCIGANPVKDGCSLCDYFDACRFRDGENGETVRELPALSNSEVWALLEGAEENA